MTNGSKIDRDGFVLIPDVLDSDALAELAIVVTKADFARSMRGADVYGARNILDVPEIRNLAHSPEIASLTESLNGAHNRPVRGIFFDKTVGANWPVAWHQDLTLAVTERREIEGWTNWSCKAGVVHVQPPAGILERMVTLRLHLDDCDADNGPLRVLPGTHRLGRLSAARIRTLRDEIPEHECHAPAGSALVIKPLLLHASSAARKPGHRRVVHLEFAPVDILPPEIQWLPVRTRIA